VSEQINLLSSIQKKGKTVTQIITGIHGYKKTFRGVISDKVEQGEFTHLELEDGRMVLVNTKNVLFVEVFSET
jgi:hypothetical protein